MSYGSEARKHYTSSSIENALPTGERSIDYLAVTLPNEVDPATVIERLGLEVESRGFGCRRYRQSAVGAGNSVVVCWDGVEPGMGVHFFLSGQGCRLLESTAGFSGWREWLGSLLKAGARVSRLDFAIDDRSGRTPFEVVESQIAAGQAITRSHTSQTITKRTGKGPDQRTVYLGSRQSTTMLRCYDKAAQMGEAGPWLRFEFEFKADKAYELASLLVREGWDAAASACRSVVDFVEVGCSTVRRCRRCVASWWLDLVSKSRHVLNVAKVAASSLAKLETWLDRQVAVALGVVVESRGGDLSYVSELVVGALYRRKQHHRLMLAGV